MFSRARLSRFRIVCQSETTVNRNCDVWMDPPTQLTVARVRPNCYDDDVRPKTRQAGRSFRPELSGCW
jgi:hypothetical protein